ncbi:AraC family transcriptional regulator [Natronoglycomyces albus]|uniref:AraC family transcriptional regulator n=1 Tax=Natronoglycomyces albus TaxID=2811108 RepID=A0A895XLU7_9ACTN|nr:AraC family transcriptional regulator [Natronoglycomyces albus]QSB06067.1 AraC family transcriptional regulator [Natronoglycomyces albus]
MDVFGDLLSSIRSEGAVLSQQELRPPSHLRIEDVTSLLLMTVVRGEGRLLLDEGSAWDLCKGDSVIVKEGYPFTFTGSTSPEGNIDGTSVVIGRYAASGIRHRRLLRALPPVAQITEDDDACRMMENAVADCVRKRPGSQIVLDRFLDWGLACTLRTWFDEAKSAAPDWYRGISDDVVGPALRAMHERPHERWTVKRLAAVSGVSRASLAKRFREVMTQPPLAYLRDWRLTLAEELLSETDQPLSVIARSIGYADAFSFSAAFKRAYGCSPSRFRAGLPIAPPVAAGL